MEKNSNKKFMITCKEATMISVKKADISVPLMDRLRLFMHLLICQYCRLFEKQNKIIDKLLKNWKTSKKLSKSDKNKLQSEIEKGLNII
jgi:hypothetical protein